MPYFDSIKNILKVLFDEALHYEHGKLIRCDI
jgi:hypothetical protein